MSNVVCSPSRTLRAIHQVVIVLIAICGFATGTSAQTTVTLSTPETQVKADVTIRGGSYANWDFSTSDDLESKKSSASYTRRILLKFDTQNYVPANAVIQSARLYLVLKSAQSSEQRPLTAYYVTRSFVKGGTTWKNYKDGSLWASAGGDLAIGFGTTSVGNAVGSTYTFDLTTLVQRVVNGDFGSQYTRVALVDTGDASRASYKAFHSTRASISSLRPRLVVTYGAPTRTPITPPPSPPIGTTLRVMQWNVHKTRGSDGVCNPDRITTQIVKQNPDIVSLNEVNFYSGYCAWDFDMGAKLESLLEQKTGVKWYRQIVNVEGGTRGYGDVLFSRIAPRSDSFDLFSYQRGVAQMTINVNGRNINVFSTHVDYANSSYRTTQIKELLSSIANFSEPRITMGDFNTWPNTSDCRLMATPYQDAWAAAKSAGTASAYNGTGDTRGGSRFDYVFYSRNSPLTLKSVSVPDTRVNGVYPSDHDPVVATFVVK